MNKIFSEDIHVCTSNNGSVKASCDIAFVKVPVLLAVREVQVDLEACIELVDDVLEIKRVKKNVFLTECKLMVNCGKKDPCNKEKSFGKLFINGFIEKNIEYAVASHLEDCGKIMVGAIKHATVKVPFRCATEIEFLQKPVVEFREPGREIDFFGNNRCNNMTNKVIECGCGHEELGKLRCEVEFEDRVAFIERPFCRLVEARIFDNDQAIDGRLMESKQHHEWDYEEEEERQVIEDLDLVPERKSHKPCHEKPCKNGCLDEEFKSIKFRKIRENIVAFLKIEVYQEQLIRIEK
ncbi:CsxC family protein [Clostridium sp. 'White wine YQ']|uniref:CsxC family protein n=1 Tax=Clostridium sp. 'White wine YQ' TaxID=3027474 RepID=UPI002366EC8E|nr:hypothetical protein [Clostridium sp. 'White wine YQ']MDD7792653.1 hypothetical protein [Clostridium sp. 'White wine YQ']